jgi:hypothetical protein
MSCRAGVAPDDGHMSEGHGLSRRAKMTRASG